MLPLHSVVYYYYFGNITGTSNKDPTSKLSCGRSRKIDGSQWLAHDTFPSCGRTAGADHSPYQLTEISWQDDDSPIVGRWLAAALRPHYVSRRQYLVKMRSKGNEVHRQLLFRL